MSVLIALAAMWKLVPPLWTRMVLLDAQRRCLTATAVPDRVVYDDHRPADQTLLNSDPQYKLIGTPPALAWCSADWQRFHALARPPGGRDAPTLFIGARSTPYGDKTLVVIEAWQTSSSSHSLDVGQTVLTPATLSKSPLTRQPSSKFIFPFHFESASPVRLFAGQADPEDPSHFTIAYEADGTRGVIDGWLRVEGVRLERRSIPSSSAPPQGPVE